MKKLIYLFVATIGGIIILESFGEIRLGKRDGTEPGHTGSPGDTLKTCVVCHGGTAKPIDGWITSDVTETGYEPGKRYTIVATNTVHGSTRFGFQVSPQALNGTLLGTLIITDTTTTQLVGNKKYVTYRADGIDGVDSKAWAFDWVAPEKGTGEVVFYGAFNANPGMKGADNTYVSKLVLQENTSTGLTAFANIASSVSVYPNPVSSTATLTIELKQAVFLKAGLYDINGKLVSPVVNGLFNGTVTKTLDTQSLPAGNYLIRLTAGDKTSTQKLVVVH